MDALEAYKDVTKLSDCELDAHIGRLREVGRVGEAATHQLSLEEVTTSLLIATTEKTSRSSKKVACAAVILAAVSAFFSLIGILT